METNENQDYSTDRRRVGVPDATSPNDGVQGEGRTTSSNIEQGNTFGTDVTGDSSPGKILSRLELLEKAFYGYVRGHQNRLKARYEESTELEAAFTKELQVIKQELRDLAQQAEDDLEPQNTEKSE